LAGGEIGRENRKWCERRSTMRQIKKHLIRAESGGRLSLVEVKDYKPQNIV
jgi:hypothetical protein